MNLYDINSALQGYGQNFNALGELGRFMLQRKAQNAQQAQQAYQNRLTDADRSRMDAERKLKQEQQDQIRRILLGSQTTTVETPYTEEMAEPVQYPDISAFMQGMGGPNLSSRDLNAPAPNPDKPWESSFVRSLVRTQELPATPSLAETMTGQKPVEPVKWQLPLAPAEMMKRTVTKIRAEQVPNENWMGDAAGKVAAIDPELGMEMSRTAKTISTPTLGEDDRTAVEVRNLRNLVASNNFANLDEATQKKYLDRLSALESGQAGTKYAPNADTQQAGAVAAPDFAAAKGEASTLIGSVKDANNDGNIDGYAKMKARLEDIIRNAGLGKADAEALRGMFADKESEVLANYRAGVEKQERARAEARAAKAEAKGEESSQLSQDEKFKAMWNANQRLKSAPGDITQKRSVMNLALRKETGAVIGADEFDALMSTVLPASQYSKFKQDSQNLGVTLAGLANDNVREDYLKRIGENYLGSVDANKLYTYMDDKIPDGYYKRKQAKAAPGGAPAGGGLAIGTIVNGYRYKGGDRKAATSWEKVK